MQRNIKDVKKMSAVVAAAVLALTSFSMPTATFAAPPGITGDDVGKMLYKFNILATPKGDWSANDDVCPNNGHRVFFERTENGAIGTITWRLNQTATGFDIVDCDGTSGDKKVVIEADEKVTFYVFVRVHGKATDSLHLVCEEVVVSTNDVTGNLEDLCLVDEVTMKKGDPFTKIMTNLVDDEYEEVLWTLDTTTGFRNAEVRIMERIV